MSVNTIYNQDINENFFASLEPEFDYNYIPSKSIDPDLRDMIDKICENAFSNPEYIDCLREQYKNRD